MKQMVRFWVEVAKFYVKLLGIATQIVLTIHQGAYISVVNVNEFWIFDWTETKLTSGGGRK